MRIGQKLSIPLAVILTGNAVNGIVRTESLFYYIMYVAIFIPIIIVLLLIPGKSNHKAVSIVLLLLSCIGLWFGSDENLVSATLFCFAIYISNNSKRIIYIYSGSIILSIILKFTLIGLNISQFAVTMAGCAFIIIIYQHYIHPKQKQPEPKVIIRPDLKPIDIHIIQQINKGVTHKAIAFGCEVNTTTIDSRVKGLRKKFKVGTTKEMLNECLKIGIMDLKVDKREFS